MAWAMPRTPFSGVRISWLMVARKALLARLAASAASLACIRSRSACLRAVMFCDRADEALADALLVGEELDDAFDPDFLAVGSVDPIFRTIGRAFLDMATPGLPHGFAVAWIDRHVDVPIEVFDRSAARTKKVSSAPALINSWRT